MRVIIILLSFLLFVSCVPVVVNPSVRINDVSGVSILPLEQGWILAQRGLYQVALVKKGSQPDSTYAAEVSLFRLPKIESEQQYLQYISKHLSEEPQIGRFTPIKKNLEIFREREAYCVKCSEVSKDEKAKTLSGTKSMIMETIGYYCQHPKNRMVGVHFAYSYRHYTGDEDANFEKQAIAFLNQIQFTNF